MGCLPYPCIKPKCQYRSSSFGSSYPKRKRISFSHRERAGIRCKSDKLLTLGIKPNRPETGYGYIQVAEHIDSSFYKVKTFTEKPELELAKVFIESGEFYWNAGLFMWNVNSIIKAGELLLPELATKLAAGKDVYGTPEEKKFIDENFPACPNVSIDFGIMEKQTMYMYHWATSDGLI